MDDADIDELSYKELQALAMSLNLPGKMKHSILVEAIRARRSGNEAAVNLILQANRQRRIVRRQLQQMQQDKSTLRHKKELANKQCLSRRSKRSAGQMEAGPGAAPPESHKKSKHRRTLFHSSDPTLNDPPVESSSISADSSISSAPSVSSLSSSTSIFADGGAAAGPSIDESWTTASVSDQLDALEGYDNGWLSQDSWKSLPSATPATFEDILNSLYRPEDFLSLPDPLPVDPVQGSWVYPPTGAVYQAAAYFQLPRPGNPTTLTVFSGRSSSNVTFCNTFARVASYVQ